MEHKIELIRKSNNETIKEFITDEIKTINRENKPVVLHIKIDNILYNELRGDYSVIFKTPMRMFHADVSDEIIEKINLENTKYYLSFYPLTMNENIVDEWFNSMYPKADFMELEELKIREWNKIYNMKNLILKIDNQTIDVTTTIINDLYPDEEFED